MPNTDNDCPDARVESDGEHVEGLRLRKVWLAIMLAELGSFRDASAAMGISQSAASRSIRSLEIELQCALFTRRGHGVEPTPEGEILLFRAKRAREQLRHAASDFGETRAEAVFGDMMRASHHEYRAFIAVYNHATASQAALFPRRQTALDQPVAVEILSSASSRRCSSGEASNSAQNRLARSLSFASSVCLGNSTRLTKRSG